MTDTETISDPEEIVVKPVMRRIGARVCIGEHREVAVLRQGRDRHEIRFVNGEKTTAIPVTIRGLLALRRLLNAMFVEKVTSEWVAAPTPEPAPTENSDVSRETGGEE